MTDSRTIPIPDPVSPFTLHLEHDKVGLWYGISPEIRGLLVLMEDPEEAVPRALEAAAALREAAAAKDRIIAAMAAAIEARRRELIARPLAHIWHQLAEAAWLASIRRGEKE